MALQLALHTSPSVPLEAEVLTPDRLSGLNDAQAAALPVRHGNQPATLGDFFRVRGTGNGEVRLAGDLARVKRIGEGMTHGRLIVDGRAGMHLGAAMQGGEIIVQGDAGDWAGAEMQGGRLVVQGSAGHLLGSAYRGSRKGMLGGEIIVHGDAGAEVGNGMRRGLIAIGGATDDFTGVNMLAGTIIVLGQLGWRAGASMRRGSIIAMRPARILPTFTYDCAYRPTFVRLYLSRLRALGLPCDEDFGTRRFHRWSGDMVELGRGEVLLLEEPV
jgi:formylmethanofuran dehydrogenase subunit C